MLALDTSGKLNDLPIFVAASRADRTQFMGEFREKIKKRSPGIAARRRIKSSDLTDEELAWFLNRIDFPFRVIECDSLQYRTFKALHQQRRKWKFEFLALLYYSCISGLAKDNEEILIDKDYDSISMRFVENALKEMLLKWNNVHANVNIAEKDDAIVAADLIAGAARRGLVSSVKANAIELAIRFYKKISCSSGDLAKLRFVPASKLYLSA